MHTFLFFSDLHLGDDTNTGYRQQELHTDMATMFLKALGEAARDANAAFVICGGDLTDYGRPEEIERAAECIRKWSCPCYLATGNHDLKQLDSINAFLKYKDLFFAGTDGDFTISFDGVRYDILSTRWGGGKRYFDDTKPQEPVLMPSQWNLLREGIQGGRRVIVNHVQACPLPVEQCGFAGCLTPENNFEAVADSLCEEFHPDMLLAGHSHLNMLVMKQETRCITASALSETPFEYKTIRFDNGVFSMTTDNLIARTGISYYGYDWNATFVQGRPCDRKF